MRRKMKLADETYARRMQAGRKELVELIGCVTLLL